MDYFATVSHFLFVSKKEKNDKIFVTKKDIINAYHHLIKIKKKNIFNDFSVLSNELI
jgi:hypothetical protein